MGHHHHHHHDHHDHSEGNIKLAFWLNTGFAILEMVGGLITNSVAILSDALHDFGDSLSLGLSWYFQRKSQQKRDISFSYGYKRFSLLGAFINSVVLIVGSVFIIREAVERMVHPETADAKGMMIIAILGLIVNAIALLRLRKGSSVNERVVSLHFLEDVLGWAAVLIGSVIMMFYDLSILDPVLSIGIAAFILFNVVKNLRTVFRIVLQGVPENVSEEQVKQEISAIKGVKSVHDIHAWSLDGRYNILTMHIVVDDNLSFQDTEIIKNEARHCLQHLNLNHITIETESAGMDCELKDC